MNPQKCVFKGCDRNKFRRGVCSRHYWELRGGRPDAAHRPIIREFPLSVAEQKEITYNKEDLWNWVKAELGIVGNRIETWQKMPK